MKKLLFAAAVVTAVAGIQDASAAELTVTVTADENACVSLPVQCNVAGQGHVSGVGARSTNHNPIRLLLTVQKAGVPIAGLTSSAFTISNSFLPAGGGSASACGTTKCGSSTFQAGAAGTYALYIDRTSAGNWKAGRYGGSVRVLSGADSGFAQLIFDIK